VLLRRDRADLAAGGDTRQQQTRAGALALALQ
jgi:hypothetical protein